jgi:UDP-N-acetylmuramyl pentapeptide phosphotransferase/UDP-N-acetylglucosamine-1-phosphate transferase
MTLSFFFIVLFASFINLFFLFQYHKFCIKKKIYDQPSRVSLHKKKIPTGSGVIIIIIFSLVLFLIDFFRFEFQNIFLNNKDLTRLWPLYLILFLSGLFFYIDDIKNLNPQSKLSFQFISSFVLISSINLPLFGFPLKIEILFAMLLMIYSANVFNFIDGFDGMFSLSIFFTLLGINLQIYQDPNFQYIFLINNLLILFLIPYAIMNKTKKYKIFLGDSGAVSIGILLAWEILIFINTQYFFDIIFFFLYPLSDVTLTLLKKIINKKNFFARDFDYFFLKPIKIYSKTHSYAFRQFLNFYIIQFIIINLFAKTNYYPIILFILINNFWMIYRLQKGLNYIPSWRK